MFRRVLVANRGEIACRVIGALRRLGIRAIAVHSEADARARHVRLADESHCIGPAPATQSYLDGDRILAVARATGAEAIHPGYGFLSENAGFAAACEHAGIVFVGPDATAIRRMGLKHEAKALVSAAGVPVIPGYLGDRQDEAVLLAEGARVGFPLLVKAVAGGGGRGMRVARIAGELAEAIAAARREAESAFGDGRVMLERFVARPRHVEVQVFGDMRGSHVHLFERECSVQRRYQKIIEESPSPALTPALRERMTAAAVRAAAAVDYVNAGTVEFIVAPGGEFYFMEMNTRLQVEHPVTELVTGLDLVEWQLRVAAGQPLPQAQHELAQRGHAIEARICCEDPARGFLPSVGRIDRFAFPAEEAGWRMDRGVEDGDVVPVHYDALIAKAVAWAPDRPAALARLRERLARTAVFGPRSNLQLLRRLLAHPAFVAGEVDTTFVDGHLEELLGPGPGASRAVLTAVADHAARQGSPAEPTPWSRDGWQSNGLGGSTVGLRGDPARRLRVRAQAGSIDVREGADSWRGQVEALPGDRIVVELESGSSELLRVAHERFCTVTESSASHEFELVAPWPRRAARAEADVNPSSPLPGRVVALHVAPGDLVDAGTVLAVVEGMKMQVPIKAARSGRVARVLAAEGDMVDVDAILLELDSP